MPAVAPPRENLFRLLPTNAALLKEVWVASTDILCLFPLSIEGDEHQVCQLYVFAPKPICC